ncbi:MAG: transcription antitermination protein NusB [Candidatus Gracilibacteria bacterium]
MTNEDKKSDITQKNIATIKVNRKKSRKLLFQELYSMSFNDFELESFKESFFDNVFTFNQDEKYINEMIKIITFYEKFFINILKIHAPKFKVQSMSLSYILPIYIGLAEMFFLTEEIPGKVSINEAVEIAKVYGDDSSKKIVNGVLNKVYKNHEELFKTKNNDYSSITESYFKK